jgi:hypothetical protein
MRNSADRFKAKVEVQPNGCWKWIAGTGSGSESHRYGRFWLDGDRINAHRASWLIFKGKIPDGLYVCHKCDYTLCVNPDHLFVGSQAKNLDDMAKKGRAFNGQGSKTACPKGHPYDEQNTYLDKRGKRSCKQCRTEWSREHREYAVQNMRNWRAKQKVEREAFLKKVGLLD